MSFKRTIAFITAAVFSLTVLFLLSACRGSDAGDGTKGMNGYFTAALAGSPATLDPQTCTDDSASQVIANVFRGLYRAADGGSVVPAMAESVSVGDDGLTWTFRLSENIRWYGKDNFSEECTADDYVFAFQRLLDPTLRAERAKEYYFIKNAKEINTGKLTDPNELGVRALGKYELEITLTEPRTDLEMRLAEPPAMPCNRKYYELTEGQYGLVGDCIGSNGAFYVKRWHYDKWVKDGNFIELRRNELNAEALGTAPRAVDFYINIDEYESFIGGSIDVCRISDPDKISVLSGRYSCGSYPDGVWGFLFNNKGVFENSDLRIALGGCVGGDFDGTLYSSADCIIPQTVNIGDIPYRENAGYPQRVSYSTDELLERGARAMGEFEAGALSGMRLIMPEGTALKQSVGNVIQQWQKNFGIYCMITELSAAEHSAALEIGDFDVAVVRLGGNGAVSYITCFSSSSARNYGGVKNRKLEDIISGALTAQSDNTAAMYCLEAEQLVLDNCWFAPLCFGSDNVYSASGVSGVEYDPASGALIFANALKK